MCSGGSHLLIQILHLDLFLATANLAANELIFGSLFL